MAKRAALFTFIMMACFMLGQVTGNGLFRLAAYAAGAYLFLMVTFIVETRRAPLMDETYDR